MKSTVKRVCANKRMSPGWFILGIIVVLMVTSVVATTLINDNRIDTPKADLSNFSLVKGSLTLQHNTIPSNVFELNSTSVNGTDVIIWGGKALDDWAGTQYRAGLNLVPRTSGFKAPLRWYSEHDQFPAVIMVAHTNKSDGDEHKHFSIYTRNDSTSVLKRLNIDYDVEIANMTIVNMDIMMTEGRYITAENSGIATEGAVRIRDGRSNAGTGFSVEAKNSTGSYIERLSLKARQDVVDFDILQTNLDMNTYSIKNFNMSGQIGIGDGDEIDFGTNLDAQVVYRASINALRISNMTGQTDANALIDFNTINRETRIWGNLRIGDGSQQKNITLTDPAGTEWNCGVNTTGDFKCS